MEINLGFWKTYRTFVITNSRSFMQSPKIIFLPWYFKVIGVFIALFSLILLILKLNSGVSILDFIKFETNIQIYSIYAIAVLGFFLIAFSKERLEDELVSHLRKKSLLITTIFHSLFFFVFTFTSLTIHLINFPAIILMNTLFFIYIISFHIQMFLESIKKKNKFFLAIVALVFSSGFAFGQNAHSMFESNSADIISAVTISDMNNYYHYMVGTDDDLKIFVTPLDYSTPFPQPDNANSRAFQLSDTYGKILLKGGFIDEEDNIVVYGYGDSDDRGVVIKITMSGQAAVSVRYRFLNYANSMFVDGCWSNVTTPAYKMYNLVTTYNGGSFARIKNDLSLYYPGLKFNNGQICAVSWDNVEKNIF